MAKKKADATKATKTKNAAKKSAATKTIKKDNLQKDKTKPQSQKKTPTSRSQQDAGKHKRTKIKLRGGNDDHPLDGKVVILRNVYNGWGLKYDNQKYLSFKNDNKALHITFNKEDAMPIKFHKVNNKPHIYRMENKWMGERSWINLDKCSPEGRNDLGPHFYAKCKRVSDATQFIVKPFLCNNDETYYSTS